jgi:tRNA pseudouridine55 synthase
MINGIINVYKEKGYTSFDVVAKMRGIFKMKKIGHTGTLDPDAEGVLPVCLGKATKICDLLTDKDKEYEAVMLLGLVTDTQDISGNVIKKSDVDVDECAVRNAVSSFVGDQLQIPPMYSALKVGGKKLCDLAREGITVERKARPITVYSIEITEIDLPRVRMKVHCSKGTYIRTLCNDIGEKLSCGACMESLLRTRVADFKIEDAVTLQYMESTDDLSYIKPVDFVFSDYDRAVVKQEFNKVLYNGNKIKSQMLISPAQGVTDRIRIYDEEGNFIGIYATVDGELKPVKMFI